MRRTKGKQTSPANHADPLLNELEQIKRLLVLLLMKSGASQPEIGLALQRDASQISRLIPASKVQKFKGQ